jgi:gamma-glutamyl-gamma-aminobutyraldehyde dehydrogenase
LADLSVDWNRAPKLTKADLKPITPLIDAKPVTPASDISFATYDPNTGFPLCEISVGSALDVDRAVSVVRSSVDEGRWSRKGPDEKKTVMHKWADLVEANAVHFNALDALEMGKPISVSAFDAVSAAGYIRFNAEAVDKLGGDVLPSDPQSTVFQTHVPRGVVAAIVPWNFPTFNCALKIAPALAAGNGVILKPSELANQSAQLLVQLAFEAGLPPSQLALVPGRGEIVGQALAEHPAIDMVSFTGSSETGQAVMRAASVNMKAIIAECGGKSPHIVFNDGLDLASVANRVAGMIMINQGQLCSVGSRVLVQRQIHDELCALIANRLKNLTAGDPQSPSTDFGPLASAEQLEKVVSFIEGAPTECARLVHGGSRMPRDGYFVEPALFADVDPRSRLAMEEAFGPLLAVMPFDDYEDAVRLARSSRYGLAAYAWTTRLDVGLKLARDLETGVTIINADPAVFAAGPGHAFSAEPYGFSGLGSEGGVAGLRAYLRRQTVWLNHG